MVRQNLNYPALSNFSVTPLLNHSAQFSLQGEQPLNFDFDIC